MHAQYCVTLVLNLHIQIQSGVSPASQAVVSFDLLSELKLILFQEYVRVILIGLAGFLLLVKLNRTLMMCFLLHSNGVSIRKVPTYSLLLSSLYPPPACPVIVYLLARHNLYRST